MPYSAPPYQDITCVWQGYLGFLLFMSIVSSFFPISNEQIRTYLLFVGISEPGFLVEASCGAFEVPLGYPMGPLVK